VRKELKTFFKKYFSDVKLRNKVVKKYNYGPDFGIVYRIHDTIELIV